jgi:hypothetical protein
VLPIAQELEAILGRSTVFYDGWYEHWIAGADADLILSRLYGEMAELVVVCVSNAYADKPWTQTEHRAVRARLMQTVDSGDRIQTLPIRVGDGDIAGMRFSDIVPDIRNKRPTDVAELIVARLNLIRRSASPPERGAAQWPRNPPELQWVMANQGETHAAFSSLLTLESPKRALLVRGASGTGKSLISTQMIRNAVLLPGVVAGRFDLKGTASMDIETQAFAGALDVEAPYGGSFSDRLGRIFAELRRRAHPTLLVFDSYELAGEAKDWIEIVLLPYLVHAPWLRVVIAGQSVPTRVGSMWESVASEPLIVQPPTPDDWFAYGNANRGGGGLNLEFVTRAHELAGGSSAMLASLLGPESRV